MSHRSHLPLVAAAAFVVLALGTGLADAQVCDPVSHPCPNHVFLPLAHLEPPIPTPTPFPTAGDVTIEQAQLLTDSYGSKMIVGMYRNNFLRWMHYLGVNIAIELRDPSGAALGTTSGWVTLKASGWGVSSCFYNHLDASEQKATNIEVVASARTSSADIGPRHHLDAVDVRVVKEQDGRRYKVVGTLVNNHPFALRGTDMAAVSVFDRSGMVVGCTSFRTGKLQPGESEEFETVVQRAIRGHPATHAVVQAFLLPDD